MADGIYSAVSGAVACLNQLDLIANNLANAGTLGFKAERIAFVEVLARSGARGGAPAAATTSFVTPGLGATDFSPGQLRSTGNPLDVALEGPGFLKLLRDGAPVYSRGGSLRLDAAGHLLDPGGSPVLDVDDRELVLPVDATSREPPRIAADGALLVGGQLVGRVQLVEFETPGQLQRLGDRLYQAPAEAVSRPATATRLRQGELEGSNINVMRGMSELIVASRAYESFTRVITSFREVDNQMVSTLGGLR
jgi:flagellar basal-body rod protein FlgF